jgi:hypothetical protein
MRELSSQRIAVFQFEVLTDDVLDPAPGKILVPRQIVDRLFGQAANKVSFGDGLFIFRTAFELAPSGTTAASNSPVAEPGTIPTELPAPPTAQRARADGTSSYPGVWHYVGAVAAAILLALLVLSHFGHRAQPDDSGYNTPDSITKSPKGLAVTETEESDDRSRALRAWEFAPTVAGTATTFGKNPCSSSGVAEVIPGIGSGELLGVIASRGLGAHARKEAQV